MGLDEGAPGVCTSYPCTASLVTPSDSVEAPLFHVWPGVLGERVVTEDPPGALGSWGAEGGGQALKPCAGPSRSSQAAFREEPRAGHGPELRDGGVGGTGLESRACLQYQEAGLRAQGSGRRSKAGTRDRAEPPCACPVPLCSLQEASAVLVHPPSPPSTPGRGGAGPKMRGRAGAPGLCTWGAGSRSRGLRGQTQGAPRCPPKAPRPGGGSSAESSKVAEDPGRRLRKGASMLLPDL